MCVVCCVLCAVLCAVCCVLCVVVCVDVIAGIWDPLSSLYLTFDITSHRQHLQHNDSIQPRYS